MIMKEPKFFLHFFGNKKSFIDGVMFSFLSNDCKLVLYDNELSDGAALILIQLR